MVIVDVVAHDKKGQLVQDLEASDFKVLEDGKEQKISAFSFQRPSTGSAITESSPPTLPKDVFRNTPRFHANSALNVILLDGLNSTLLEQAYVRDEMIKFLEKLPRGYPVAIYLLGKKLRLLQDFTTDLDELTKVIRAFKGKSSHALADPTGTYEIPMTLQGWAEQTAEDKAPQLITQINGFAQENTSGQMDIRIQGTVAALTSLARMLAAYPGRKNLIWVTDGIPLDIVPEITVKRTASTTPLERIGGGGSPVRLANSARSYGEQLALLGNLLTDAQIAVYPIDARGLVGSPFYNVANPISGAAAMGGLDTQMEGKQAEELFQAHSNMLDIAQQTGGRAFYNRNDIDAALRTGIEDGSTYYALAYYPKNKKWNGKFRKIKVSTRRKDVKLRYRSGYFAVDRAAYMKNHPLLRNMDFGRALGPDAPVTTAIQFQAKVTPPSQATKNKVVLNYAIDPHFISFERRADGLEHAQVDCAVRVFSRTSLDKPVKTEVSRVNAHVTQEVFARISKSFLPCHLILELPKGHYYLRLGVRDNSTSLMGTMNAEVTVPAKVTHAKANAGAQTH